VINKVDRMENWLETSRSVIQQACTPWGIKASLTDLDNYSAIFTRDAVMAGIAGILLNDREIIEGFKQTIINLKILQGKQGQIASNFKVTEGIISDVSFGTLSPKIDACTWYLIGVGLLIRKGIIAQDSFKESISLTISLLDGLEYNGKHLMYIPKGGNWADEYIYEGYILYDQVLRSWGLSLLGELYQEDSWRSKSVRIKECLSKQYQNKETNYYDSSLYPGGSFSRFDLAAHSLAGFIFDEDDLFYDKTLDRIYEQFIAADKLPPAFHPVINTDDTEWMALRGYHLFDFKNKPYHYHNGGIWCIWLGWLSIAFSLYDKDDELDKLNSTAFELLNSFEEFDFEEYISSDKLQLYGTKKLCYTATGIIMLILADQKADFSILKC